MIFQNYGLFWHVERVRWGRPGLTGELLGTRTVADGAINFRYQRGIYALYDDKYALLYIGQAGYNDLSRLYDRLNTHRRDHLAERWQRFSWFGIDPVRGPKGKKEVRECDPSPASVSVILNHLEAILIATAEPKLNLQRGRFGDAEQFFQEWEYEEDEVLEGIEALSDRMTEVEKRLRKL